MAVPAVKILPPAAGTFIQMLPSCHIVFIGSMAVPANGNKGVLGAFPKNYKMLLPGL